MNVRAVVTGSITLGLAWSLSSIAAAVTIDNSAGESTGAEALFIPVVGPFIAIGTMGAFDAGNGSEFGVLLILDGLAQTGGLVSIIFGALGRNDSGNLSKNQAIPEVKVGLGTTQLKWNF